MATSWASCWNTELRNWRVWTGPYPIQWATSSSESTACWSGPTSWLTNTATPMSTMAERTCPPAADPLPSLTASGRPARKRPVWPTTRAGAAPWTTVRASRERANPGDDAATSPRPRTLAHSSSRAGTDSTGPAWRGPARRGSGYRCFRATGRRTLWNSAAAPTSMRRHLAARKGSGVKRLLGTAGSALLLLVGLVGVGGPAQAANVACGQILLASTVLDADIR